MVNLWDRCDKGMRQLGPPFRGVVRATCTRHRGRLSLRCHQFTNLAADTGLPTHQAWTWLGVAGGGISQWDLIRWSP